MDWLRKIVSGNRKRYQDEKYDLDVTYVTCRVLAMSFPATGLESCYRNNINDVKFRFSKIKIVKFLQQKHNGHYRVFNMSGRKYDFKKFDNKVENFEWEDHHSPQLHILFEACQRMYKYLRESPENVVVIHCNAGKGRTGTMISCFLIYSGMCSTAKEAINYYGWKRFSHGKGVTQPSQIRYVQYFEQVYKKQINSPILKSPEKIIIHTIPQIVKKVKPYLEVVSGKDFSIIWTNKHCSCLQQYQAMQFGAGDMNQKMVIEIDKSMQLTGDIYFRLKHLGSFKHKLICRFAINTSFVKDNVTLFTKKQVDPDRVAKNPQFSDNFLIEVHFKDICQLCESQNHHSQLCGKCHNLLKGEIENWKIIERILINHPYPTEEEGKHLLFSKNGCDYQDIMNLTNQIGEDQFEEIKFDMQYDESESDGEMSEYSEEKVFKEINKFGSSVLHVNPHRSQSDGEGDNILEVSNMDQYDYSLSSGQDQEGEEELEQIDEIDEEEEEKELNDLHRDSYVATKHLEFNNSQFDDLLMSTQNQSTSLGSQNFHRPVQRERCQAIKVTNHDQERNRINKLKYSYTRRRVTLKKRPIMVNQKKLTKRSKSADYVRDKRALRKKRLKKEYSQMSISRQEVIRRQTLSNMKNQKPSFVY